jgi:hypothetical protein
MRRQQGVPLEQVAANLRRLRGVLTVDEHRSAVHQIGNRVDQYLEIYKTARKQPRECPAVS